MWNPNRQAGSSSQIYLDKHSPNSCESYVDHYIRYANLASSLEPPLTDMDLLCALTSHYEQRVRQGLLWGNFKCTQDILGYLSKIQGLNENRGSFKAPRRHYTSGDVNRRPQLVSGRDDRPREWGIMSTFTGCAGRQTDVTQITATDVTVMQTRENFMDAGRGERRAIAQASLTLTHSNLTRTSRTGMSEAKLTTARL